MKVFLLKLSALLLSDGARGQGQPDMPYMYWSIGMFAPDYMELWVESVDMIDLRGLVFDRAHAVIVAGLLVLIRPAQLSWTVLARILGGDAETASIEIYADIPPINPHWDA